MRRHRLVGLVLLVAATALAHGRCVSHGFVYDDHRFVEKNAALASLASPQRFFLDASTASAAQGVEPDVWRPLRTLGFAVDYALFHLAPRGWHVENLLLHGLAAALVWLLLLRVFARTADGRPREALPLTVAATGGALLFAVHPVTVEAVSWVSSRGDLLAWVLVLLALEVGRRRGPVATAGVVALGFLACLAKESAVVAFLLLPLHHLALPASDRPARAETVLRSGLLLGATVGYLAWRSAVLPTPPDLPWLAQTTFPDDSRAAALRGFFAAVVWYARTLLVPLGFPFDRNALTDPVPASWGDPAVVLGAGIVLGLVVAGFVGHRRRSRVAPWAAWGTLIVLVPASNVVVPLKAFAAQRFLYPALPCLVTGVVAGAWAVFDAAGRRAPGARTVLVAACAALLVALGFLCDVRTRPWRDDLSLWTAVRAHDPMNPRAYEGLGFELLRAGEAAGRTVALTADEVRERGVARRDALVSAERMLKTYREFAPADGKARAELAAVLVQGYANLASFEEARTPGWVEHLEIPAFPLVMAIQESRAAMDAWEKHGLSRARGDRALRRSAMETWRTAALDLYELLEQRARDARAPSGDGVEALLEASRVNALLAADDLETRKEVGYAQRRTQVLLAVSILDLPPAQGAQRDLARRKARATLLSAVGVEPALPDRAANEALVARIDALLSERPRDEGLLRRRIALVATDLVQGLPPDRKARALDELERDLGTLIRMFPRDRDLADRLEVVRRTRDGR